MPEVQAYKTSLASCEYTPSRNKLYATVLHTGYSLSTMASSTERCRKHRARRRAGLMQFAVELPVATLEATLVSAGWMEPTKGALDSDLIECALQRALWEWCGAAE